jgi:transposase
MRREELNDKQWEIIEPLIPKPPVRARTAKGDRSVDKRPFKPGR